MKEYSLKNSEKLLKLITLVHSKLLLSNCFLLINSGIPVWYGRISLRILFF
jgi:hypothetical protein